jgi:hypothetical protein
MESTTGMVPASVLFIQCEFAAGAAIEMAEGALRDARDNADRAFSHADRAADQRREMNAVFDVIYCALAFADLLDDKDRLSAMRWRANDYIDDLLRCTRAAALHGVIGRKDIYGPNNPPRLRRTGESIEDYRREMGWAND